MGTAASAAGAPASAGSAPPVAMNNAAGAGGAPAAMSGNAGASAPKAPSGTSTLFYLDNTGGRVLRANADGSKASTIVPMGGSGPDGVAVDVAGGHVFWTNMGLPNANDGTVMRADLDGKNVTTIVKSGDTYTPKQLKLEPQSGKLYWSDREGMKVQRANLDGSMLETLIVTGTSDADRNDARHWCVGIALDVAAGKIYWSQKGGDNAGLGSIRRANIELPAGADPAKRTDIEVLFDKLPEPIDLDIDPQHHLLYWTDRGDNTVSRAPLDPPAGADPAARTDREILVKGIGEAIGISLDLGRGKMYYTSLAGVIAGADLDGKDAKNLLTGQGIDTGIAQVDLP
jgi:DNA-binding beta-propeller fold protein YncE